ncbi:hypothetical protein DNTS_003268 [Danionella cerebrum]|uniref:Rab9 effector protein with kelch motifs n=1 Tax=Danionella cerebrum TaxID=2873325 RepID=A0A553MVG8_9TELE|nr:hypothetical protein DNTS_003268 [Danionella translucida]
MELLPVLEPEEKPQPGIWYVLQPSGEPPGVTVGHTCTFLPPSEAGKGKIVIVGGANPSGSFSESHVINLDSHEWDIPDWEGLEPRYEHCSFVPQCEPESLYVFAGAEKSGNHNSVQALRLPGGASGGCSWSSVQVCGVPPSPRTYHTSTACVRDQLFVFSGGDAGATAVSDAQLHVFDTVSRTWTQPDTVGTPPSPRHGHVIAAVQSELYIHGGISGEKILGDMFKLCTETLRWQEVTAKGDTPPPLAAHACVSHGRNIFIFGGMTAEGAINEMFQFHCDEESWTRLKFTMDPPSPRLDHSMCLLPWRVRRRGKTQTDGSEDHHLCFVFGGMDTQGLIFNDCLVTLL